MQGQSRRYYSVLVVLRASHYGNVLARESYFWRVESIYVPITMIKFCLDELDIEVRQPSCLRSVQSSWMCGSNVLVASVGKIRPYF